MSYITCILEVTGDSAILINSYNIEELDNALVDLLNNETLKAELSEK